MSLYLIRHAIAVPRESWRGKTDDARPLTARGIRRMRRNVAGLCVLGVSFDAIWTSPLTRAWETAQLIAELPTFTGTIEAVSELAPGDDKARLFERIAAFDISRSLALVGHEPDLGRTASMLLTGTTVADIRFKKGGIACFRRDPTVDAARAALRWMLTPKQMRSLTGWRGRAHAPE